MNFVVYCHTNRINGKSYVGWTKVGKRKDYHSAMMHRWNRHCAGASKSTWLFGRAIHKWGTSTDTWDHQILEVMSTLEGAKRAEILWIDRLKTFAFDTASLGYNMTRGGDGTTGIVRKGKKLGPYKPRSAEHSAAISAALKNHIPWNKGMPSPQRGIKRGPNKHPMKTRSDKGRIGSSNDRSVRQLSIAGDYIATFTSISQIRRELKISVSNISACCRGKRNQAQGFRWEYV
jgi:hypothetical protein